MHIITITRLSIQYKETVMIAVFNPMKKWIVAADYNTGTNLFFIGKTPLNRFIKCLGVGNCECDKIVYFSSQ